MAALLARRLRGTVRRVTRRTVLVKRLVCIEDLGDIDVLFTDKTGTLTEGHIALIDAVDPAGVHSDSVLRAGLLATGVDSVADGASADAMDAALWAGADAERLMRTP